MNKNDNDLMNQLSNLNDLSVEEIAEKYPAINKKIKKRIFKKCLKKNGFSAEIESDGNEAVTVSGIERYKRRHLYRFAASAAAFVVAVGGITSVFMLNRNPYGNNSSETEKTSALIISSSWTDSDSSKTTATASKGDNIGSWETTKPGSDANNDPVSLSGTYWYEYELDGPAEKSIEFGYDGFSGHYVIPAKDITTTESTKIPFTYEKNGYDITFSMGSDAATAKLSYSDNDPRGQIMMTLVWANGDTEYFYNDAPITSPVNDNKNETSQTTTEAKEEPTVNNTVSFDSVSLNETYWTEDTVSYNSVEFNNDGFSGHYIIPPYDYTTQDALKIYFTYTQNGNEISIRMGSDTATGTLSSTDNDPRGQVMLTIVWADGRTEYLYTYNITINPDGSFKYYLPSDNDYSAQPPIADTTLNGTYWCDEEPDGTPVHSIEFGNDGFSGHYITPPEDYTKQDPLLIYFTYTKNGNEIMVYRGSDIATGKLSSTDNDPRGQVMLTLVWADGSTEYFYNHDLTITDLQN